MMTFTFASRAGIAETIALTRLASLVIKKRGNVGYSLPFLSISLEQPTLGSL